MTGFQSMHRLLKWKLFIFFVLLTEINFLAFAQPKKNSIFSPGTTAADYTPGLVWVKIHEPHRSDFESGQSRKMAARLQAHFIQPLLPAKSIEKNYGRMAPRKTQIDIGLYYQITFDKNHSLEEFIYTLQSTGQFEKIEPVRLEKPLFTPDDASISQQYYLDMIKAYDAWDITQGSESIVIGIVDSGGDLDHPDLQDKLFINEADPVDGIDNDNDGYIDNYRGWDFSGDDFNLINTPGFIGDNNPSIPKGNLFAHGTRVAGCAAASTNNGIGIAGVGYKTKLLFTKHYADNQADNSTFYSSNLYLGVLYAATHGAKIINCSWGSSSASIINQDIIKYVTLDLGCLVIAAAGNSNSAAPVYPAAYDYVLSVAASDEADLRYAFSSYGHTIDLTAPGVNIYSTMYNDTYASQSGTSFSAPIAAGAAALVWAHYPNMSPLQVAEKLRVTADESFYLSNPSFVNQLGKGRLDIVKALTVETPSIRASNPLLVAENSTLPQPGESANLYFDFTNYLHPSTGSLMVSLSSTSPYLSIFQDELTLGVIAEMGTIRNSVHPFQLVLSEHIPVDVPLEFILTYSDGDYSDFQIIRWQFPQHMDVNENNITTSVASNGRLGFADTQNQQGGSGFLFNGQNLLYEMGLIMGTSSTDLFNNVRSIGNAYDQDFTPTSAIAKSTPGERSSSEVHGDFRNSINASSESLKISYRSLVWAKETGSPYNDFVILEYRIKNTSTSEMEDFYFGIFADWDIAQGGGADKADWNSTLKLGYVFPAQDATLPHTGIQLLTGNVHYVAIDNDHTIAGNPFGIYDGFTDAEKFSSISGFPKTQAGNTTTGNDVSHVISSGPYTIPAGEEVILAFALHGASTYENLITSSKYADSVYNFTLKAPQPLVELTQTCSGTSATLSATGASHFKWYTNFTGGEPIVSGTQLTTAPVFSDTTFYVSNADNSFESVRTKAIVSINPNPIAAFSYSGELFSGEPISFADQSSGATSWQWTFGDGATSTEPNPQHLFQTGGNFSVALKAISDQGCHDEEIKLLAIITGLEEFNDKFFTVYPNPVHTSMITIQLSSELQQEIEVNMLNMQGQSVRKFSLYSDRGLATADLSACSNGMYLIKITTATTSAYRKVIISR